MANSKLEENYFKFPNELWEALTRIRIPGEARQVLDFIFRKTLGWNKSKDCIPLSQFNNATGLKKPSIIKARNKLIGMNLITVTKKDNAISLIYCINKDYSTWRPLPKKKTLSKKLMTVNQKANKSFPKKLPSKDTNAKNTITKERSPNITSRENIEKEKELDIAYEAYREKQVKSFKENLPHGKEESLYQKATACYQQKHPQSKHWEKNAFEKSVKAYFDEWLIDEGLIEVSSFDDWKKNHTAKS